MQKKIVHNSTTQTNVLCTKGDKMKLLDVLAKELKEWPEDATCIVQDYDGEVKAGFGGAPTFSTKYGMWLGCSEFDGLFESDDLCEQNAQTIITKRDWDMFNLITTNEDESQSAATQTKHKHAEMIALCAEFAKTMEDPMTMFQRSYEGNMWIECAEVEFKSDWKYRLKPKTKLINGFEIPDLPFTPFVGCEFYCANIGLPEFYETGYMGSEGCTFTERMVERGLIYPYTEEGKEAAIAHSKVLLGIKGETK